MTDKFNNKYRIPSNRLSNWDYGSNAAYFVTICTQHRECWFGGITDGVMELSSMGQIAHSCWCEIPHHFPFVELGAHVIMPNHVHGIVIINKPSPPLSDQTVNNPHNQFGVQSQNLASIIRGFKIGVTKNARQIDSHFAWQSRYHDQIIRDTTSFHNISEYIINNPLKWLDDTLCQK